MKVSLLPWVLDTKTVPGVSWMGLLVPSGRTTDPWGHSFAPWGRLIKGFFICQHMSFSCLYSPKLNSLYHFCAIPG